MPNLKLIPLLEATTPERLAPTLAPFIGPGLQPLKLLASRLQPPVCYWATYAPDTTATPPDTRRATLKAFFAESDYADYVAQLHTHYSDRIDRPDDPLGGMLLLPDLNAVLWSFPFDPSLPTLHRALDAAWIAEILECDSLVPELRIYNPEIGAIFAYRPGDAPHPSSAEAPEPLAYGKSSTAATSALVYVVMNRLFHSDAAREGLLRLAQPLAFRPDAGLLLQAPVPGSPLHSDRNQTLFLQLVRAAGSSLAALHDSDCPFGPRRTLDRDLRGLRRSLDDLTYVAPGLHRTFRLLLDQLDRRAARHPPQPLVPTHGDYKWDQLLEHDGQFWLIDFELFCQAEPARDVGYFAAYLPPSRPHDAAEMTAAETLRAAFFDTYAAALGDPLDVERVSLYEAATLGLRALSHVWRRRADWQLRAAGLIELALTRLVEPLPLPWPQAS